MPPWLWCAITVVAWLLGFGAGVVFAAWRVAKVLKLF